MKIYNLKSNNNTYSSNVYFITGTWKRIDDPNTIIDVGRDPATIEKINNFPIGVGQKRVSQVVLTHCHYDHASLLPEVREAFNPAVYAFSHSLNGVDHYLRNWQTLRFGDRTFEVIHMPGHSSDSVCYYCEQENVLFAGDSPVIITSTDENYEDDFVSALERICQKDVGTIYFGHGEPLLENCNARLSSSLKNVRYNMKESV